MKDLLLVLFYQAIVAVNTAVILSGIIWLAKRKEEKDERKQTPDFTPPPTVRRGGYQPKPSGTPKPPTTGTNAITPKEHKYDKFSCLCFLFCDLTREQVLDGLDRYIKGFSPNDLLDRVENEIRKRIKDDQRTGTQPIQSFIGEVRGGPGNEVMGTVTAKSAEEMEEKLEAFNQCETCRWSDDMGYCHNEKLCNPEKKPYFAARKVNPNQPFCWYWEQAFRTDSNGNKTPARISIAKPKERNAFGVDSETAAKIAKAAAGNAGASATDEIAEKLNEIAKAGCTKQITPDEAKKPPCKECRCFDGETGDNFGLCFNREEIVGTYDRRLCFKPKGASKVKPNPATRPAPLGTVTIGGRKRE